MNQIDEEQLSKIMNLIDSGKEEGASLVTGGERVGDKGYFVAPTVFANVKDDMTIAREEVSIKIRCCKENVVRISIKNLTIFY